MPPTPDEITLILIMSLLSAVSDCTSASVEPCTSALITRFSESWPSPPWPIWASTSSMRLPAAWTRRVSRRLASRWLATSLARRSSATTTKSSPASGTPESPSSCTGMDGPASSICLPFSSNKARTRPYSTPQTTKSPFFRVPCWTSTVATGPRPLSRLDSITAPDARPSRTAFSSISSACSEIASSRASTPSPVLADNGTNCTSPPQSSGTTSCWMRPCLTFSGFASGLSILLTATISGTLAARACLIASTVCGLTPSSAATTRMTISVACAPRWRIEVNAAWPGVSRKVITPFGVST